MTRIDGVPMYYRMPAAALRPDLLQQFPRGATTLDLIRQGLRTSTTRRPFAKTGDVITFQGHPDPYREAQQMDEALLRKAEIEQLAYEQEVAQRLAILSRRYPQATPHELLSMPGVL